MNNNHVCATMRCLLFALMLSALLLAGCAKTQQGNQAAQAGAGATKDPRHELQQRFEALKDEYAKLPPQVKLTNKPYIKGKIVYLWNRKTENGGEVLALNDGYLSDDSRLNVLYAHAPEEVQTVVLQNCQRVESGSVYVVNTNTQGLADRTLPALVWKCELTLVDRSIPAVIYKHTFQSKLPETITVRDTQKEGGGPPPWEDMAKFLLSLPRQ
jgi:outer membrane murein-binding lipoprotein Lpp